MADDTNSGGRPPDMLFQSAGCFLSGTQSTNNLVAPPAHAAMSIPQFLGISTDPSAVLLISPRALQSQAGTDMFLEMDQIETFVFPMDEGNQSVISIRVSRGKSQVNLSDPSRTHRRAGPKRLLPAPSLTIYAEHKSVVQFKSELDRIFVVTDNAADGQGGNPEQLALTKNNIFPSPVLDKPFSNLKPDYDFYTPGQTMEAVRIKLERIKDRMSKMRDILRKKENALKEMYLVSGEAAKVVEIPQPVAPATAIQNPQPVAPTTDMQSPDVTNQPQNLTEVTEASNSDSEPPTASPNESAQAQSEDESALAPSTLESEMVANLEIQQNSVQEPPVCLDSEFMSADGDCLPKDVTSSTGITEEPGEDSTPIPLETTDAGTSETE